MNTIEEKATDAWLGYEYRAYGSLYSTCFIDGYVQGAEEAMREPWIRWADRKPEEGLPVIIIRLNYELGNPAYEWKLFGLYNDKIAERTIVEDEDTLYWLPLPKGKEEIK